ncbi:MAG: hypothetical protein WCJ92_08215 [Alphaproteobacteria bacterium]
MPKSTYRVSSGNQLSMLSSLILSSTILISISVYNWGYTIPTYVVLVIILLTSIIPTFIVHYQYLKVNRGLEISIDIDNRIIEFFNKGIISSYSFDDIKQLTSTSSYGGGSWYSFGDYKYCKLVMKDKKCYIITCLLIKNLEDNFISVLGIDETKNLKLLALLD